MPVIADHGAAIVAPIFAPIFTPLFAAIFTPVFATIFTPFLAALLAMIAVTAMIIGVRIPGGAEHRAAQDHGEQESRQLCAHTLPPTD
jgi:hypothetical protein